MARMTVRPPLLNDAREHVLRSLSPGVSQDEAERLATLYTQDFLARKYKHRYRRVIPDPDINLVVPCAWRTRLIDMLDPVSRLVLRAYFGDGYTFEAIQKNTGHRKQTLVRACAHIRAAGHALLGSEGVDLSGWSAGRLNRMIRRIANQAQSGCPGPGGLLSPAGEDHARRCPRCSRALRLINWCILSPNDLFIHEHQTSYPDQQCTLLAVLLHPDGRKHHTAVDNALGQDAIRAGRDCWLVDASELSHIKEALFDLARHHIPPRHLLRGACVQGAARWSRGVLLGPLPVCAIESARSRPWSEVDRIGELPPPLPPAPRATRWWATAGVAAILASVAGYVTLRPAPPTPLSPIDAHFHVSPEGIQTRFDVDDLAVVDVVVQEQDAFRLAEHLAMAEKGRWATGEGDFLLDIPRAERVLIISSQSGVTNLPILLEQDWNAEDPLAELARQIQTSTPLSDVSLSPAPVSPAPENEDEHPSGSDSVRSPVDASADASVNSSVVTSVGPDGGDG